MIEKGKAALISIIGIFGIEATTLLQIDSIVKIICEIAITGTTIYFLYKKNKKQ